LRFICRQRQSNGGHKNWKIKCKFAIRMFSSDFYRMNLECNWLTERWQLVHEQWHVARRWIGQPASLFRPGEGISDSWKFAYHFHLHEPFLATLHNNFNIVFDTMVFAHESSDTVLPMTLEQCWAAHEMSGKHE
jgi:hypothetical protein